MLLGDALVSGNHRIDCFPGAKPFCRRLKILQLTFWDSSKTKKRRKKLVKNIENYNLSIIFDQFFLVAQWFHPRPIICVLALPSPVFIGDYRFGDTKNWRLHLEKVGFQKKNDILWKNRHNDVFWLQNWNFWSLKLDGNIVLVHFQPPLTCKIL